MLDDGRGSAVLAIEKLTAKLAVVPVWIPEQLRQHPRAQLSHLRALRLIGALLEYAAHVVGLEKTQVRTQREPVRMRLHVVREIRRVIPDIKSLAKPGPTT